MKQNKQNNENVTLLIEENKKIGKALEFLSKRIETLEKKIDNDIATSTRNSNKEFLKASRFILTFFILFVFIKF